MPLYAALRITFSSDLFKDAYVAPAVVFEELWMFSYIDDLAPPGSMP